MKKIITKKRNKEDLGNNGYRKLQMRIEKEGRYWMKLKGLKRKPMK